MQNKTMNPPVFWGATAVIFALLAIGTLWPSGSESVMLAVQATVINDFGWFYVLCVVGFLVFVVGLAISPLGKLRLGQEGSKPDYSYGTWLAMLFAAGMGIGLMFFAVAEPITHYASPPEDTPMSFDAAREAMVITFLHWGVHAWAIYALIGLCLAYFAYRRGLPLTLRSGLQPLLGKRADGPIGDIVDIFAIVSTLFGIATSLGFGVTQINSGLQYLIGLPFGTGMQLPLIAAVTAMATLSVVSGLDVGIRRLSELNLICALLLMIYVLCAGPTIFLLKAFVQNLGMYLDQFFVRSFQLYAYEPRGWMSSWTLFYWAWWIAWSPFVGMFIARISKGRTVREFVIGVLLVPSLFSFLWMTVFGNSAIAVDMGEGAGAIAAAVQDNLSVAIFRFFEYLPLGGFASALAVFLVAIFFVTSSDSGSLVVDTIAAGGSENAPVSHRIYWCVLEGFVAATLLVAGGLGALQTATLVSALPFAVVTLFLAAGLLKSMREDAAAAVGALVATPHAETELSWRKRLAGVLTSIDREEAEAFLRNTAAQALWAVRDHLRKEGVAAEVDVEKDRVTLNIPTVDESHSDFVYDIKLQSRLLPVFTPIETSGKARERATEWVARAFIGATTQGYEVTQLTRQQLLDDVLVKMAEHRAGHI